MLAQVNVMVEAVANAATVTENCKFRASQVHPWGAVHPIRVSSCGPSEPHRSGGQNDGCAKLHTNVVAPRPESVAVMKRPCLTSLSSILNLVNSHELSGSHTRPACQIADAGALGVARQNRGKRCVSSRSG